MSKKIEKALFVSLKETFALGIQEFSRSLTGTLAKQATSNQRNADDSKIPYDINQISKGLDLRESQLSEERF